jgi:hypothetical protein
MPGVNGHTSHTETRELFHVMLLGQTVDCAALEDAAAVKAANDILTGDDPTPYLPEHLAKLVDVLIRYGRRQAANALAARGVKSL